jgi:hypothetical protein
MKTYCTKKSDIPTIPHWAIVYFTTHYIPGDDRSKSCPGHGYPERIEKVAKYCAFDNENEWKADITARLNPSYGSPDTNFVAMKVTPATISSEIVVRVNEI